MSYRRLRPNLPMGWPLRYVIYCDESDDKGRYFSNFYGGALLRASDRQAIEAELEAVKAENRLQGEAKWTKISEYNEAAYIAFVDKIFEFAAAGLLKIRIIFTQNINQVRHLEYEQGEGFFKLYYQFIKHAFGLAHCNPERATEVTVAVLLDDAPDTAAKLENFKWQANAREGAGLPAHQRSDPRAIPELQHRSLDGARGRTGVPMAPPLPALGLCA